MFSSKNPDDSPEALACFPFIPYPQCKSQAIMTSQNYVRIVCSPISVGKALHMHRRAMLAHLHTCQHPCRLFSTTIQEPCHHFHNLNSKPVTYRPATNMPLKYHICQLLHLQIGDNYISTYTSSELTTINNVTRSIGIHSTLLAYAPEQRYLPHCTYVSHCTSTVVCI